MGSILLSFERKLAKRQYISTALFNKVQKREPKQIPEQFNLDEYNDKVLEVEYLKLKDYFDNLLNGINPNIRLNKEQSKTILADEDCELVTTDTSINRTNILAAKVKYLVEIKNVAPEDILVLSCSKYNTDELRENINELLKIPVNIISFYSLGYDYIKQIMRYKNCQVVSNRERDEIFLDFLKQSIMTDPDAISDFIDCFNADATGRKGLIGDFFLENYHGFRDYDDYLDNYIKHRLSETNDIKSLLKKITAARINAETPHTLLNEQVKSKDEAIIANWLYRHSINYEYKQVFDELLPDTRSYRPDFTLDIGGRKIYIEFFKPDGNYDENSLNRIREKKELFHRNNNTEFIILDYEPNNGHLETLRKKLEKLGVCLPRERSAKDIYASILYHDSLAEFHKLKDFFYEIIDTIKLSKYRKHFDEVVDDYLKNIRNLNERVLAERQYKYVRDFYIFYNAAIHRDTNELGFDLADMIYYAKVFINHPKNNFKYKYIIIDEYQDIPTNCYELARGIFERHKAKLVVIGDNWQTVCSFTKSKMERVYDFRILLKNSKSFEIASSRNAQDFMMESFEQIRKRQKNQKNSAEDSFVFLDFKGDMGDSSLGDELQLLKQTILTIHRQRPDDSILILARTNTIQKTILKSNIGFEGGIGTEAFLLEAPDCRFNIATIQKSKSLKADWVIVVGLNRSFINRTRSAFWLLQPFVDTPDDDNYCFAEERRILYVASIMAKYKVILLRNAQIKKPGTFLNDFYSAMRN